MKTPHIHFAFVLTILIWMTGSHAQAYRDLETGTFLTRDPAGMVDGPNLYTYVKQNPWSAFDPSGLNLEYVGEHTERIVNTVSKADPRLSQIVDELKSSPYNHKIAATWSAKDAEGKGKGYAEQTLPDGTGAVHGSDLEDRYNGKGSGTFIQTSYEEIKGKPPEETMAHELGHAFDINRGISPKDPTKKTIKNDPRYSADFEENENNAVRTENIYNEATKKHDIRREYPNDEGDRKSTTVDNPEGKYAPVSIVPKETAPKKVEPTISARQTKQNNPD